MMDQLWVVLVHAPDVSARTAIVQTAACLLGNGKYLAAFFPQAGQGGVLNKSLFPARNVPAPHERIAPRRGPSGQFVRPKSGEAIPFVSRVASTHSSKRCSTPFGPVLLCVCTRLEFW